MVSLKSLFHSNPMLGPQGGTEGFAADDPFEAPELLCSAGHQVIVCNCWYKSTSGNPGIPAQKGFQVHSDFPFEHNRALACESAWFGRNKSMLDYMDRFWLV